MGTSLIVRDEASKQLVAYQIAEKVPDEACGDLIVYIDRLLEIRASNRGMRSKLKDTLLETGNLKIIWPTLKILLAEFRKRVWSRSNPNLKIGIVASSLGLVFFGGAKAGIAALGGAVAVPLWVVFGAGAMYANHIRQALVLRMKDISAPIIDA